MDIPLLLAAALVLRSSAGSCSEEPDGVDLPAPDPAEVLEARHPVFLERVLDEIPRGYLLGGAPVIARDGETLAIVIGNRERWAVATNGERGPWFDRVGQPVIGPDGCTVVYDAALRDSVGRWRAFVTRGHLPVEARIRGAPDPPIEFEGVDRIAVSREKARVAYIGRRRDESYIVIEDTAHPIDRSQKVTDLWFDTHSQRAVCVTVDRRSRRHVYVEGRKDPSFDPLAARSQDIEIHAARSGKVVYIVESGWDEPGAALIDGARHEFDELRVLQGESAAPAFCARRGARILRVAIDMESLRLTETPLGELPEGAGEWTADARGANLAFVALEEGKSRLIVKGPDFALREPLFDGVEIASIRLDPEARTAAYIASERGETFVVANGRMSGPWRFVSSLLIGAAGNVVFLEDRDGEWAVVEDRARGPSFDRITDLGFAPDRKTVHYKGERGGKMFLVIAGKPTDREGFDEVRLPSYSEDGATWAHRARRGDAWFVVSSRFPARPFVQVEIPAVSSDGEVIAYAASTAEGDRMVINGEAGEAFDHIFAGPILSPDSRRVAFGAMAGLQFLWEVAERDLSGEVIR